MDDFGPAKAMNRTAHSVSRCILKRQFDYESGRANRVCCDDHAPMREALSRLFRSIGMRAQIFSSAEEFVLIKRPDAPACLVLEVRLPRLSGLELQRRRLKPNRLKRNPNRNPGSMGCLSEIRLFGLYAGFARGAMIFCPESVKSRISAVERPAYSPL